MIISIDDTSVSEIVSKFYNKSFDEKDIEKGTVSEHMVRMAILCAFEVIDKEQYREEIEKIGKR